MFNEYKDWISESEHNELRYEVVYASKWKFGQVSDDNIKPHYPMWFQSFYELNEFDYKQDCPSVVKTLGERFMEFAPDNFIMVRCMASSNTFGIDGDVHTDWPFPKESVTGVLYTDKEWERNWGGETILYDDQTVASQYEPRKLIIFDSSIPHVGKGPQRRCPGMRSVMAFQAIHAAAAKKKWPNLTSQGKKETAELVTNVDINS